VVVADRGALPERIGDAGLAVEPEKAGALLAALDALLADSARLQRMASAPRALRTAADAAREHAALYVAALSEPLPAADAAAVLRASLLGRDRPAERAPGLSDLDRLQREARRRV
jgi:hypothetical protein